VAWAGRLRRAADTGASTPRRCHQPAVAGAVGLDDRPGRAGGWPAAASLAGAGAGIVAGVGAAVAAARGGVRRPIWLCWRCRWRCWADWPWLRSSSISTWASSARKRWCCWWPAWDPGLRSHLAGAVHRVVESAAADGLLISAGVALAGAGGAAGRLRRDLRRPVDAASRAWRWA
jgi:hypothetical protein